MCALTLLQTGCSSTSDPPSSVTGVAQPSTGSVTVTARTTRGSSTLSSKTASSNGITVTIESAGVSKDGTSYQTLVAGPVKADLAEDSNPMLGTPITVATGDYGALRVTVSDVSWSADWVTTNPSPCDGATSGHAGGGKSLGSQFSLYFMTPTLGGNTRAYYQTNPPLTGYVGDANHPLIMSSPVTVLGNKTTTVNLVFDTDHMLSCNRIALFSVNDTGDVAPQRSIGGVATELFGTYGLFMDTRHGLIGATNDDIDSINFYDTGASADASPTRTIRGPATMLNDPRGAAFYRGASSNGSQDEIIVANRGNNSITIYPSTATGNVAPDRIITGFHETELNQPADVAVYPVAGAPNKDEIWVTNTGNNTVTVYNRSNTGDAAPIYPNPQTTTTPQPSIGGSATGLLRPCGIDVAASNNKVYVFVANAGNNSVTIYDRDKVVGTTTGNVAPLYTLSGPDTGLSSPCGIDVDPARSEIFVANTGTYDQGFQQSSITVYDWSAILQNSSGTIDAQPIRTLKPGVNDNSGLTAPVALLEQNGALWVADRGTQPAMTNLPGILPSPANGDTASSSLAGQYNVILYGVDLSKGINGQGYHIPTLFAERGVANFDSAASPWPAFNLRIDTENRRTVINPGCGRVDIGGIPKEGFYSVDDDGSFYAFNEGDHGSIRGGFLPNGRVFVGSFYNNSNKQFVIYGIKDTGLARSYLGADGSQTGASAVYAYASYSNSIVALHRFDNPPSQDIFRYQLQVGIASANYSQFDYVSANEELENLLNPMGDFADPQGSGVQYRPGSVSLSASSYSAQAGGEFEDQGHAYGMAGAVGAGGSVMLFMSDTANLDANNCPVTTGMGMALRQSTTNAFTNADLKGVYFVAGFGDQFRGTSLPNQYLTEAGTLTFDGTGGVNMAFDMNNQGQVVVDPGKLTYEVATRNLGGKAVNEVDLFGSDKTTPFASAAIAEDGKTLMFYRNLYEANTGPPPAGNTVRVTGLAVYEHP